ncbi:hypothetical protein F8M41_008017 [Gigaspora margarita]|uniref:Uncharacterized protein n=1 Tax=Gigaspora margarita TaxID=4874 RepID=A0A8H4A2N8_GIGMA|nr:hypothetical protein F8M41_008017 [Gigaspora margarita]
MLHGIAKAPSLKAILHNTKPKNLLWHNKHTFSLSLRFGDIPLFIVYKMDFYHNNLFKIFKNILFLLLLNNFTVEGNRTIFSSSRNDLSDYLSIYENFAVSSSYDGNLVISFMDDKNQNKAIYALLQNGSTTYIGQNFMIVKSVLIYYLLLKMEKMFHGYIFPGADISLFEFLMSGFAGFEIFNAPFSDFTINWIYWGTVINTLIEEIPQLIVQILYFEYTVKYEAIPFLTLLTGSIALLNNIIFKLFKRFSNQQPFLSKNKFDGFTIVKG